MMLLGLVVILLARRGLGFSISRPLRRDVTCFRSPRSTGAKRPSSLASVALPDIVGAYNNLLATDPLVTKSLTSSVFYGIGDVLAQKIEQQRMTVTDFGEKIESSLSIENESVGTAMNIDFSRVSRYMLTGLGSGVAWTYWYDASDSLSASVVDALRMATSAGNAESLTGTMAVIAHTAAALCLEQFLWCPLLYASYLIPLSTLLNGGEPADVPDEVQTKLGGLLVSNAKVWTLANILIYNVPIEVRVLTSNVFDIAWAVVCAEVAAECGMGPGFDDDVCATPFVATPEDPIDKRASLPVSK